MTLTKMEILKTNKIILNNSMYKNPLHNNFEESEELIGKPETRNFRTDLKIANCIAHKRIIEEKDICNIANKHAKMIDINRKYSLENNNMTEDIELTDVTILVDEKEKFNPYNSKNGEYEINDYKIKDYDCNNYKSIYKN